MLCAALALLYAAQVGFGLTNAWALSGTALRAGRWWTLFTHMGAHGGLIHLAFNLSALAAFGTDFVVKLGRSRRTTAMLLALFLVAGLAGGLLYLALTPVNGPGAVGASGAIFGLWGATARLRADGTVLPLFSAPVRSAAVQALIANLILILPLALMGGGLAWQAHLGGFLAGLALAPAVARRPARN